MRQPTPLTHEPIKSLSFRCVARNLLPLGKSVIVSEVRNLNILPDKSVIELGLCLNINEFYLILTALVELVFIVQISNDITSYSLGIVLEYP
jgi:hypothetical protein